MSDLKRHMSETGPVWWRRLWHEHYFIRYQWREPVNGRQYMTVYQCNTTWCRTAFVESADDPAPPVGEFDTVPEGTRPPGWGAMP